MEENNSYDIILHSNNSAVEIKNSLSYVVGSLEQLSTHVDDFLHSNEKLYYETLVYPLRQKSYLLGKMSVKSALLKIYPYIGKNIIEIKNGVFGFPYIVTPDVIKYSISNSHTNNTGVCLAFDQSEIMGIDIEEISISRIETIASELTMSEIKLINNLNINVNFAYIMIWTIKEALSKVLRCGMLIDFKLLEISKIEAVENYFVAQFVNFPFLNGVAFKIANNGCALVFSSTRNINFSHDLQARFS